MIPVVDDVGGATGSARRMLGRFGERRRPRLMTKVKSLRSSGLVRSIAVAIATAIRPLRCMLSIDEPSK